MTNSFHAIIERLAADEASIAMEGEQLEKEYAAQEKLVLLNRGQLAALRDSIRLMQLANAEDGKNAALEEELDTDVGKTRTVGQLILQVMSDGVRRSIREVLVEINEGLDRPYAKSTVSSELSTLKGKGKVLYFGQGMYQVR